jgi:fructokinase
MFSRVVLDRVNRCRLAVLWHESRRGQEAPAQISPTFQDPKEDLAYSRTLAARGIFNHRPSRVNIEVQVESFTAAAPLPSIRLGIDMGGTKIEIIALDAEGRERLRSRVPTPRDEYEGTLGAIANLVRDAEHSLAIPPGRATIGIGTPGSISRATGLLRGSNSVCLNGRPLQADLERALRRPVRITNDANCFALSEATDGAGAGADVVFGVILGTGVGAGIVVHGRVLDGPNAIAGEWGHNPLPWPRDDERPGHRCFCGRDGCIETWVAGPGIARDHLRVTGRAIPAEDIVTGAMNGDVACEHTLLRYEQRLARALAHVVNIIDPDVIVLGGGMSNVDRLYANVPKLWGPWIFSDRVDTRLVRHMHGDSSGVRGAAWLWGNVPSDMQRMCRSTDPGHIPT